MSNLLLACLLLPWAALASEPSTPAVNYPGLMDPNPTVRLQTLEPLRGGSVFPKVVPTWNDLLNVARLFDDADSTVRAAAAQAFEHTRAILRHAGVEGDPSIPLATLVLVASASPHADARAAAVETMREDVPILVRNYKRAYLGILQKMSLIPELRLRKVIGDLIYDLKLEAGVVSFRAIYLKYARARLHQAYYIEDRVLGKNRKSAIVEAIQEGVGGTEFIEYIESTHLRSPQYLQALLAQTHSNYSQLVISILKSWEAEVGARRMDRELIRIATSKRLKLPLGENGEAQDTPFRGAIAQEQIGAIGYLAAAGRINSDLLAHMESDPRYPHSMENYADIVQTARRRLVAREESRQSTGFCSKLLEIVGWAP